MAEIAITGNESRPPVGWRLWLWWVVASTAGFAVGRYVSVAVGRPADSIVTAFVFVALGWIATGVLQWLALQRQVARGGLWVPAGIVGAAVAGVGVFGLGVLHAYVGWVVGVILFAPVVGLLQWWLVLRWQVARAGRWVLASTVGWVVGMAGAGLGGWPVLGAGYGAVTGLWLVRLLREPVPAASAEE